MKKISLILVLISTCSFAFSQQDSILKSKSGKIILPQKGDIAIGISADPILNFLGNLCNSSGSNRFNLGLLDGNSIYGKYFLNSKSAIRLKLSVQQSHRHYENNDVIDNADYSKKVTDKEDNSISSNTISVGYERRKGDSRLQLSYGAELSGGFDSYDQKYSYGNPITANNIYSYSGNYYNGSRVLENKQNQGIAIGARAFSGLEYFIFPKISIGGEIGLGYVNQFNGKSTIKTESWDYSSGTVKTENVTTSKNRRYDLKTDILNGQVFLLFHI
jgi:hypothetical protein